MPGVVVETLATVNNVSRQHIVAHCARGVMYYLQWKGNEPGYLDLKPGDLVRVYHSGGMNPTVHTFEALAGSPADAEMG